MAEYELERRDFVLLVRQNAASYTDALQPTFASVGIPIRNEAHYVGTMMVQDLLVEEVSKLVLCVLRVAMTVQAGRHWTKCQALVRLLRGIELEDEIGQTRFTKELDDFTSRLSSVYPVPPKTGFAARKIVEEVVTFVGRKHLVNMHPAYRQGNWFEEVLESTAIHLARSTVDTEEWLEALDNYEGVNAIPLMTIHKSKGLEYHTVIFIGLDDDAWWSFEKDKRESTAGFFVAFTRAQQRVVFTYCRQRKRDLIAPLYSLLQQAGVQSFKID